MRGVRYVTDDDGKRVAVILDLDQWGDVWEDISDALLANARRDEPTIPLEEFAAALTKDGDYRIVYRVDDAKQTVEITVVRHRSAAYE